MGGLVGLVALAVSRPFREWFESRCVGRARAEDLAYVRAVTCLALGVYVLSEDLSSFARLDTALFRPPGYMSYVGTEEFRWFLSSEWRLRAVSGALLAALALAGAGVWPCVTVPLAALSYLPYVGLVRAHAKMFHEGYLAWYVLIVLGLLYLGHGRRKQAGHEGPAYGWMVWGCYAAAVVPYAQLAYSKLRDGGIFWFDGRGIRNYMLADDLNIAQWEIDGGLLFYRAPTFLFTLGGFLALCVEATYLLVLVLPRLRLALPAAVILLHSGIFLLQDFPFVDAILLPAIFFIPSRLRFPPPDGA